METFEAGGAGQIIAANADTGTIYVGDSGSGTVRVLDSDGGSAENVNVGNASFTVAIVDIAVNHGADKAYVLYTETDATSNATTSRVGVIDSSNAISSTVAVQVWDSAGDMVDAADPRALAIDQANGLVYVATESNVAVINGTDKLAAGTAAFDYDFAYNFTDIAAGPSGHAYGIATHKPAADAAHNTVQVITVADPATGEYTHANAGNADVPAEGMVMGVEAASGKLFVLGEKKISVYNVSDPAAPAHMSDVTIPGNVSVSSASDPGLGLVYAVAEGTDAADGGVPPPALAVIRGSDGTLLAEVTLPEDFQPQDVAVGSGGDVLVLSANGSTRAYDHTPATLRFGALFDLNATDKFNDLNRHESAKAAVSDYNEAALWAGKLRLDMVLGNMTAHHTSDQVITELEEDGENLQYYIGPSTSADLTEAIAHDADLTFLSPTSTAPSLAIAGDNAFRIAVSSEEEARVIANLASDASVEVLVPIFVDDAYGTSLNDTLTAAVVALDGITMAPGMSYPDTDADWDTLVPRMNDLVQSEITAAQNARSDADVAVAFLGFDSEFEAVAAGATNASTALRSVHWYLPDAVVYPPQPLQAGAVLDFSKAVNLTSLSLDIAPNEKTARIDAAIEAAGLAPTAYDYSTYDAVHVLALAAEAARAADPGYGPAELRAAIPGAAEGYTGALGDIILNSKGDLRTPDKYAVWQLNATSGDWVDTKIRYETPVVDVGALLVRGEGFNDDRRGIAFEVAVDDFNIEQEGLGDVYLNLKPSNISISPAAATASLPNVTSVLAAAFGGEGGPSYFVGPSTSGNSKRALDYSQDNDLDLVLVSPSSTAPSLAVRDDSLFRLVPNDHQQGVVLADIVHNQQGALLASLLNETGIERVVTVTRDDTWGTGLNASTSERLAVHLVEVEHVTIPETGANWTAIAEDLDGIITRLHAASATDPVAVLFIGFQGDFNNLAAVADNYAEIKTVPWFGTDGIAAKPSILESGEFAEAVNLTATIFDVENNTKFAEVMGKLEAAGVDDPTIYEFSSYDAIFVLGRAIQEAKEAAAAEGRDHVPEDVRQTFRHAAREYSGALGDIVLNAAGDLRTPNSYAKWEVRDAAGGGYEWAKTDTYMGTPVVDFGALLLLDDNLVYTDDKELLAMRLAVDDFNTVHELIGDFYLDMHTKNIRISPDARSSAPDALAGITEAHETDAYTLFIGPSTSGNTGRVLAYANAEGLLLISHSSTAPALAIPDDSLYRLVPDDTKQGVLLAELIKEDGITRIISVIRDDVWGRGLDTAVSATFEVNGAAVADRIRYAESGANWADIASDLSTAIDAATAQHDNSSIAVVFIGFGNEFASIASHAAANSAMDDVAWYVPDGTANSAEAIGTPAALEFARSVNLTGVLYDVAPNDVNRRLVSIGTQYSNSAYDAVGVLGAAVKAVIAEDGSYDPLAVRAAVTDAARNYTGALGDIVLNEAGDIRLPQNYAVFGVSDAEQKWVRQSVASVTNVYCADQANTVECIDVGGLFSTEPRYDREQWEAVRVAVNDFNKRQEGRFADLAANDTGRYYLNLVRGDSSAAGLQSLHNSSGSADGPLAYVGPTTSSALSAAKRYSDETGVVLVSPYSTSSAADLRSVDSVFRLTFGTAKEAPIMAQALDEAGIKKVIPVVRNDTYGTTFNSSVSELLPMLGLDTLAGYTFQPGADDWDSFAADLNARLDRTLATEPRGTVAILFAGFEGDFESMAEAAKPYVRLSSAGGVPWFVPSGILYAPRAELLGANAEEFARTANLTTFELDVPQNKRIDDLVNYYTNGEVYTTVFSYSAYDSLFLIGDSIGMARAAAPAPNASLITSADVKGQVHAAAAGLDGALGPGISLDAAGDLHTPNRLGKFVFGPDGWTKSGTVTGPDSCGIRLATDGLNFDELAQGATSAALDQTVTNMGTLAVSSVTLNSTSWTFANSAMLPSSITEISTAGNRTWTDLAAPGVLMPVLSDIASAGSAEISFRVNLEGAPALTGSMNQTVAYSFSCD